MTKQVGGAHYQMSIEPIDYIVYNDIPYREGNVIKYVTRHKSKNGKEDLLKAIHYIEMIIEDYEDEETWEGFLQREVEQAEEQHHMCYSPEWGTVRDDWIIGLNHPILQTSPVKAEGEMWPSGEAYPIEDPEVPSTGYPKDYGCGNFF